MYYKIPNLKTTPPNEVAEEILNVARDSFEIIGSRWTLSSEGTLTITFLEDSADAQTYQVAVREDDIVESDSSIANYFRVLSVDIYNSYKDILEDIEG